MKMLVVFDKETNDRNLHTGWGVSFLVGKHVLFDTGEDGKMLIENIKNLSVDINELKKVVISHDHYDHTGGLWQLLDMKKGLDVYACPDFSDGFKKKVKDMGSKVVENTRKALVDDGIFVTGEIAGEYAGRYIAEQALVVDSDKGISVITGCAHPGVLNILENVKAQFPGKPIYIVYGGFHMQSAGKKIICSVADKFKKLGVIKAGPTHCSGHEAEVIFSDEYKKDFLSAKVGDTLEL
jgi:7,8-dihydropterin-6-yl-methyl-4-(beta-D-ribofuranosyl)aminobenzene 5'-phosphate synthase